MGTMYDRNTKLTSNFLLKEFITSSQFPYLNGSLLRDVQPKVENLFFLCHFLLQPIRDKFDVPVQVNSGFRNETLNAKVGGSPTSNHQFGRAADIVVSDLDKTYKWCQDNLNYGELFLYDTFIHIALPEIGKEQNTGEM